MNMAKALMRKDHTGERYGKLVVRCIDEERTRNGKVYWWCDCDCGDETSVQSTALSRTKSCGCARNSKEAQEKAMTLLAKVGLAEKANEYPCNLSGGQCQRVAIARALVNDPAVILADEATGNLDTRTSFEILVLFQELFAQGRTIIFVTHNPEIAQYSSRNIVLRDGLVKEDVQNTNILSAAEALAALPPIEE
jgi:ABC-type polar amino acid transport system ATPase subunit